MRSAAILAAFSITVLSWTAAGAAAAQAQAEVDGELVYRQQCARCHEGGTGRMASSEELRERTADQIYGALNFGLMRRQGLDLSDAERRAVAMYLSGGAISDPPIEQIPQSAYCATDPGAAPGDPLAGPAWNGWGNGSSNARFQSAEAAGMTAEDVPNLRLKWAFGFPGADSSGSQASVAGGRILIGSRTGLVYAIGAKSGCIHWIHEADDAVRSSPAVGPGPDGSFNVYFGDHAAYVYALDFATGDLRWKTLIGEHIDARITAAPVLHDGRLYVGLASGEEGTAVIPTYECCTFRGSTVALAAATGEQLWRRYVIAEEPTVRGRNAVGAPMWGPSGAGVWSTPTVDPARNTIYVATGDSYSNPPAPESDAIMALAADTGEVRWITQTTPGDAWNVACMSETEAAQTNCPENEGPDVDYAASTILTTAPDGREVVLAGQKSGMMYAMDPDTGDLLWETRVADGGILGGIEWGFAIDAAGAVYAATSDALEEEPGEAGGLTALSTANGEVVWYAPPVQDTCGSREGCHTAQPGAVSAIPGVVFATSLDGHLRAHATDTGRVIWDVDTVGEYDTVNDVPGRGGSLNGPGVTVVDGMLYVNSGYGGRYIPGNVLLAFSVDGQ